MKELTRLYNLVERGGLTYNHEGKERFKQVGMQVFRKLAKELKLREFDVNFNPGGIAVSGDLRLMGMFNDNIGIYIHVSEGIFGGGFECYYRTIKNMKDYSGGANNWAKRKEDFLNIIPNVYRLCGVNPTELVSIKPVNLKKPAFSLKQLVGKYDERVYGAMYEIFQNHLEFGNYFKINGQSHDRIHDLTMGALFILKKGTQALDETVTFPSKNKATVRRLIEAYRHEMWEVFEDATNEGLRIQMR